MADLGLSSAKAILLAVQLASKADLSTLRTLVSRHPKGLRIDIILRILLTHLPESLDSSAYVPFLQDIQSGNITEDVSHPIDLNSSGIAELSDTEAVKRVKKLRLLPLTWPNAPEDVPTDPFVLFLVHRSLRIDENTGLITQIPGLLAPFLHLSHFLRTWLISTVLPLLRFSYEYYPQTGTVLTISAFEDLDYRNGVSLLLSNTAKGSSSDGTANPNVGRDLRGLVGAWMYGDTRAKRRKLGTTPIIDTQLVAMASDPSAEAHKLAGWEEVFKWIAGQAVTSWQTAVEAVEQWDGPGDVDFGSYRDGSEWLDEEEQQYLERRYARTALATAYLIRDTSMEALSGVHRIISRISRLIDHDTVPTLSAAAALLLPASGLDEPGLLSAETASRLRNHLLEEENILTTCNPKSIQLIHTFLLSAYLLTRQGVRCNVRRAGELALLQHESEQKAEFVDLLAAIRNGPKGDDKYWVKTRNEILWLHSWGLEELGEGTGFVHGKGLFGSLKKEYIEAEILKLLLANTRYTLAQSIYEAPLERPLPPDVLCNTIISAAMNAYDNATNANKTRGGVKRCLDILNTFRDTLEGSLTAEHLRYLVQVTHEIGQYRLVLKKGEPFTPVILRVHSDPISIIGKVLDQNQKAYTKINEFIKMGEEMVMAGLTVRDAKGHSIITREEYPQQKAIAEKRVVSMCIDAALAEDDFETAYSYVVTRLKTIGEEAQTRLTQTVRKGSGLTAQAPAKALDDWSWRAALQAGKYKRVGSSVKPTHFGNTTANLEIRHLEQRIDCLAHALRLAPKSTLQEILNVYRRCEEELEAQVKSEAEQEAAWDIKADDQTIPGSFASAKKDAIANSGSRAVEEAPMSLFDLSRASITRAQSGFAALSMLRHVGDGSKSNAGHSPTSEANTAGTSNKPRIRKRDQLRNVAVGSLASGIGWLINAPPINEMDNDDEDR
ncbi:Sec39 domain-containing protein [Xylogone sp. PMI_703]|nr:Sec39 domain-containing protein [Xylogone sp. PMI_703]